MCRNKIKKCFYVLIFITTLCSTACMITSCSTEKASNKESSNKKTGEKDDLGKKELLLNKEAISAKGDVAEDKNDNNESTSGEVDQVHKGDFEYEMFAIGNVKYTDTYYQTVNVQEARLIEIKVAEGDYVEKGDVILTYEVQYDETELNRQLSEVDQREREYNAGLDTRRAEINQAEHELKSITNKEEQEIKRLEIKKLKLALKKYTATKVEINDARKEAEQFKEGVQSAELKARCSGYILSLSDFGEGDVITKGMVACVISPEEEYVIEVEDNSGGTLRYNDKVKVSIATDDGSPDIEIDGLVIAADNILSSANVQGKAYVRLIDEPESVDLNNAIKVYYKSKVIKDVLMVASDAVLFEKKGEGTNIEEIPYVYVCENGETNKRYIEVFESNDKEYLILQGLREGEKVVIQK